MSIHRIKGELNSLKRRLAEKLGLYEAKKEEAGRINAECSRYKAEIASLKQQIKSYESHSDELKVTEHAMLRYFERIEKRDLDGLGRLIVAQVEKHWEGLDRVNGIYPVHNLLGKHSFKVKVRDDKITTILL